MAQDVAEDGRFDDKDFGSALEAGLSQLTEKQAALTVERLQDPTAEVLLEVGCVYCHRR